MQLAKLTNKSKSVVLYGPAVHVSAQFMSATPELNGKRTKNLIYMHLSACLFQMYREIQSWYSARKMHGAAQPCTTSYVYPMIPEHPIGMSKLRCIDDAGGGGQIAA